MKQLRGFLLFVWFYRIFIVQLGLIASPIHFLLRKENRFIWTSECQQAFEQLKAVFMQAPVSGFKHGKGTFSLCIDSSLFVIGAMLSQTVQSGEKVTAYASKTL